MALLPVDLDETTAKVLTSSDNLDNITQIGNYTWSSSSIPVNAPFTSNATMSVNKIGSTDGYVLQTVFAPSKIASRQGDGLTEMGNWYIHFDKEKIRNNFFANFVPRTLHMTQTNTSQTDIILYCSGGTIQLRSSILIDAGTYTCDAALSSSTSRYYRIAKTTHSDIKTFLRNCAGASKSIDDYAVGEAFSFGAANVVSGTTGKYVTSGGLLFYRYASNEWDLLCGAFTANSSTSYKLTLSDSRRIVLVSGASSSVLVGASYDPVWD